MRASHSRAANLTADLEALRADHAEAERTIVGLRSAAAAATPPATAPVIAVPLPVTPPLTAPLPSPEPVPAPAVPEEPAAVSDHADTPPVAAPPATVTEAPAAIAVDPSPGHQPELEAEPAEIATAAPDPASTDRFVPTPRDALTRIRGIDDALQARLSDLGIVRFEDLEKLSAQDEMALEQRLSLPVGYVAREQWRPQAALLRAGQNADHAAHFAATAPASL